MFEVVSHALLQDFSEAVWLNTTLIEPLSVDLDEPAEAANAHPDNRENTFEDSELDRREAIEVQEFPRRLEAPLFNIVGERAAEDRTDDHLRSCGLTSAVGGKERFCEVVTGADALQILSEWRKRLPFDILQAEDRNGTTDFFPTARFRHSCQVNGCCAFKVCPEGSGHTDELADSPDAVGPNAEVEVECRAVRKPSDTGEKRFLIHDY